ncbi:MAG: phosphodiester glycosidase family protein [Gemmatimonadaceae bacterium]|nr:phosphodiester glycosidase family protein [Gemmatimonadaceae bacterium]
MGASYRVVVAAVMCAAQSGWAQTAASPARLAPGLTWWRASDARGPWNSYVVRIDLRQADLELLAVHARDALNGRERTSSIAQRHTDSTARVRVAVNADFFDLKTGASENNQVTAGEWWKGLMLTQSPYDTYDNVHAQVAIGRDRRAAVDRYVLEGRAIVRGASVPVLAVNALPMGPYESTALYTPRFGATTPRDIAPKDSVRKVSELALRAVGARGDTLRYVVAAPAVSNAGTMIPANGAVLAGYGDRATAWQAVQVGDTVGVVLSTLPRLPDGQSPATLLGGWPRLLEHGVNVARDAAIREGTISRNAEAPHPRTAIGVSKDRRTVWLYVVDGRSTASVGMTTSQLADALRTLGAWDALNFDGGGSTTLVVDGQVINTPSDATGEREVGNALLVRQRLRRR